MNNVSVVLRLDREIVSLIFAPQLRTSLACQADVRFIQHVNIAWLEPTTHCIREELSPSS